MVPKASDDLPEPDTPVNATMASRGTSTSTSRRLFSRAPRTRTKPSVEESRAGVDGVGAGSAEAASSLRIGPPLCLPSQSLQFPSFSVPPPGAERQLTDLFGYIDRISLAGSDQTVSEGSGGGASGSLEALMPR